MTTPRLEPTDYYITIGSRPWSAASVSRPRRLTEEYGLTVSEASILLGQCVDYDLGNIYDPAYIMVCRLARGWLRDV